MNGLWETLWNMSEPGQLLRDEPMSRHTTFRVGGPADVLVTPEAEKLAAVTGACREAGEPYYIVGNGSNLLVGDGGIRGVVILTRDGMDEISADGVRITAGAGALLSRTASLAASHALTGMEFAAGIPGTIGGAVVMNAGAYGGEMSQIIVSCRALMPDGALREFSKEELKLGYRTSVFSQNGGIVTSCRIKLQAGDRETIYGYMRELAGRRTEKQPLNLPSAGSTFKRPEGYFAGKLIQDAGLRGYQVGGAQVSEKHCGFVINKENATATDVVNLIHDVQRIVYEKFQVQLDTEVKFLGEF